jgi:hypothetical protein
LKIVFPIMDNDNFSDEAEFSDNERASSDSEVDRSDMMISFVKCIRKTMRWYKKLLMHIIDLAMFKAHALYVEK